ncbi:MAG TPA: iron-sulfur cluster biosynthesis family protein, partial [Burkholderiaceae bacterium]
PGGCSGYSAEFSAEAAPQPGEQVLDYKGLSIFLPTESRLMLEGVTMDFAETPTQSGLTFFNPNQAACGCSSSGGETAAPPGVARIDVTAIGRGRPAATTLAS